jgi:cobalamin biosynthesis Mg chelatase CobN
MTKLLDEAFSQAARLSEEEQDAFARFVLEELKSEARWAQAFADSRDELASLAKEAAADYKAGRTRPL